MENTLEVYETLPIVPLRDVVVFPHMMMPFVVGRPSSTRALEHALLKDKRIFLAAQHDASVDDPRPEDIYTMGCVANVVQSLKLPDGNIKVLVEGVDVRDLRLDELRAAIGVVAEDTYLFSASIRDNIAFGRPDATDDEVRLAKQIRATHPDLPIIARARDPRHAAELYRAGVTDAVPETLESSLQLSEAVLVDLGVAMGPVIASVHEKREELRDAIRKEAMLTREPRIRRLRRQDEVAG